MAPRRHLQREAGRDRGEVPAKGSKVYLEGRIESRKYTDKDGQERETTEIVLPRFGGELTLLDSKNGGGEASEGGGSSANGGARSGGWDRSTRSSGGGGRDNRPRGGADLDDAIPF